MEVDGIEKDVFVDFKEEERELGYLDMFVEIVLFRVDINFGVINKCNFSVGYFLELVLVNISVFV